MRTKNRVATGNLQARGGASGPLLHRVGHGHRTGLRRRGPERRLPARYRLSRRVSLHARRLRLDVSRAAVDDAPVRRLRPGRGYQRPLPFSAGPGTGRPVHRLRHAHPDGLRRRPRTRQGRGRPRGGLGHLDSRYGPPVRSDPAGQGHHLDDRQLLGVDSARDVPGQCRAPGHALGAGGRHDPERHAQGVHRAKGMDLPAAAGGADRYRHDRVLREAGPAMASGVDFRLPHPRGRLDRGAGTRLHPGRRHLLRRGGAQARARRSTISPRVCPSSSTCTTTSSKRWPSCARRAGSGRA